MSLRTTATLAVIAAVAASVVAEQTYETDLQLCSGPYQHSRECAQFRSIQGEVENYDSLSSSTEVADWREFWAEECKKIIDDAKQFHKDNWKQWAKQEAYKIGGDLLRKYIEKYLDKVESTSQELSVSEEVSTEVLELEGDWREFWTEECKKIIEDAKQFHKDTWKQWAKQEAYKLGGDLLRKYIEKFLEKYDSESVTEVSLTLGDWREFWAEECKKIIDDAKQFHKDNWKQWAKQEAYKIGGDLLRKYVEKYLDNNSLQMGYRGAASTPEQYLESPKKNIKKMAKRAKWILGDEQQTDLQGPKKNIKKMAKRAKWILGQEAEVDSVEASDLAFGEEVSTEQEPVMLQNNIKKMIHRYNQINKFKKLGKK